MKTAQVYAAIFVACFFLGATFVLLSPRPALAGPSLCSDTCYLYFDCGDQCPPVKYPYQVHYGTHWGWATDIECLGPFDCDTINWGCHICQP